MQVNHIIICGHYDCPLLTPSMLPAKLSKSHSSASIASLKNSNSNNAYSNTTLSPSNASSDPSLKISKRQLAEISVLAEIDWLKQQPNVQAAIAERGVVVHGFVYDREAGRCVRIVEERWFWESELGCVAWGGILRYMEQIIWKAINWTEHLDRKHEYLRMKAILSEPSSVYCVLAYRALHARVYDCCSAVLNSRTARNIPCFWQNAWYSQYLWCLWPVFPSSVDHISFWYIHRAFPYLEEDVVVLSFNSDEKFPANQSWDFMYRSSGKDSTFTFSWELLTSCTLWLWVSIRETRSCSRCWITLSLALSETKISG